jgi:hypothetical protein
MACISGNDSCDLAAVLHSVFEQDQIHNCVEFVVTLKSFLKSLRKCIRVREHIILLVIQAFYEVGEHKRLWVFAAEEGCNVGT